MGSGDSRSRSVSYGVDEKENVTVLHGVKLSSEVLRRMREAESFPRRPEKRDAAQEPVAETREWVNRRLESEQQEEQKDHTDTHILTRQLKRKENQLKQLEEFYKEQLQQMEKKDIEDRHQTLRVLNQQAEQTQSAVKPRQQTPVCAELQAQVLGCYRQNPAQTLQCSRLVQDYISCIRTLG